MKQFDVIFPVIAPREVIFFANIAENLERNYNFKCGFITFYEPGDRYLLERGYNVFSLHKNVDLKNINLNDVIIKRLEKKFKIDNIRKLILHEKLTFNRYGENKLLKKVVAYDRYFNEVLTKNRVKNVVQELGGFIAPLTLYYNCRFHRVNHVFIEPAMYKGRLFFNVNSIDVSLKRIKKIDNKVLLDVKEYIKQYNINKTVVIPAKDRANFLDAGIKKLVQKRYVKRFFGKLYSKYIKKEKEEYDAIFNQMKNFFLMFMKRKFMTGFYSIPDYNEKYVYFPLHVPLDFQLTIREPQFLNQLALIESLSNILPYGVKLYIKEHPASIGGYNYWELRRILKNDNIKLIHPRINSYDLIKNSLLVITINSKVGAEALMQEKNVAVLGKPYYKNSLNVYKIEKIEYIKEILNNILNTTENNKLNSPDYKFFRIIFQSSHNSELYLNSDENIKDFSEAIYTVVS